MKKVGMGLLALGAVLFVMVSGFTAAAEEKPSDNMQIVREKVRADKKLLVAESMQLTEAEAKAFWPVYEQYQDELFLLRTLTVKLINDFADAYEKMNNETAKKLMDEQAHFHMDRNLPRKALLPPTLYSSCKNLPGERYYAVQWFLV